MARETVLIKVLDGGYEVLRSEKLLRQLDLESLTVDSELEAMRQQAIHLGRKLENEPMDDVVLEVYTADGRNRLRRFAGGPLL